MLNASRGRNTLPLICREAGMSLSATLCRIACASVIATASFAASNVQAEKSPNDLYLFKGAPDGEAPFAPLIEVDGNLYSTTTAGGTGTGCNDGSGGCGSIFRVTPAGKERLLHSFQGGC